MNNINFATHGWFRLVFLNLLLAVTSWDFHCHNVPLFSVSMSVSLFPPENPAYLWTGDSWLNRVLYFFPIRSRVFTNSSSHKVCLLWFLWNVDQLQKYSLGKTYRRTLLSDLVIGLRNGQKLTWGTKYFCDLCHSLLMDLGQVQQQHSGGVTRGRVCGSGCLC